MYKSIWYITEGNETNKFTYYHFGKNAQFPKWYMEEDHYYEIELLGTFKLIFSPCIFLKCLKHSYCAKIISKKG